jgi:NTE family protein
MPGESSSRPRSEPHPGPDPRAAIRNDAKSVNIALQGGGAHGAFAWGVLDYLLEDGRLDLYGISGASAGAMNAVVLAHGVSTGGREGGRAALEGFWRRVSEAASYPGGQPFLQEAPLDVLSMENAPAFALVELMTRLWSPYQFNPLNFNPLRSILEASVDFPRLRTCPRTHLHLTATNVRSGKIRVFGTPEVSPDVVMASACLPLVFQAVEIDGEAYWDGGFMGNPAIFPLIYDSLSRDVIVVHVNPLCRPEIPRTATEIQNRINEISFNSSLMREMRAIAFVTRLIDDGKISDHAMKRMLIHSIAADDVMQSLSVVSKMNTNWEFLTRLRDVGRERAELWLNDSFDKIGEQSTADLDAYL